MLGSKVLIEVGDVYLRIKVFNFVWFYSLNKHCVGWFINTIYNCTSDCKIHLLPKYHVWRLWNYDRKEY